MPPSKESSVIRAFAKVDCIPSVNAIYKGRKKNGEIPKGTANIGNNKYRIPGVILFHDEALLEFKESLRRLKKKPTARIWKEKPLYVKYDMFLKVERNYKSQVYPDLDNLIKYPQDIFFKALNILYPRVGFHDGQIREVRRQTLLESPDRYDWIYVEIGVLPFDELEKIQEERLQNVKRYFDVSQVESPEDRYQRLQKIRRLETNRLCQSRYREKKKAKPLNITFPKTTDYKTRRLIKQRFKQRQSRADRLGISLEEFIEKYGRPTACVKEADFKIDEEKR
ncbi:MAG: hypothetical protein OXB93_00955 [Cytophagales bacterium]|nr:hypothetical protein [Cytophagales bacterium]